MSLTRGRRWWGRWTWRRWRHEVNILPAIAAALRGKVPVGLHQEPHTPCPHLVVLVAVVKRRGEVVPRADVGVLVAPGSVPCVEEWVGGCLGEFVGERADECVHDWVIGRDAAGFRV